MERLATTSFGQRSISAALLENAQRNRAKPAVPKIDKWVLFQHLCTGRKTFGLNERDLSVLNALLTFHPNRMLDTADCLIVFPSNQTLMHRAHGMAESTLRRHLARLVQSGLLQRHDSPNGKRYARSSKEGAILRAFGFDLTPLLIRASEISQAAADAEQEREEHRMLREKISLARRDLYKFATYAEEQSLAGPWQEIQDRLILMQRVLRRKLNTEALQELMEDCREMLDMAMSKLAPDTDHLSATDSQNDRLHSNSNKTSIDSETSNESKTVVPQIPLNLILKACPDISPYARHEIRHWHELISVTEQVYRMLGITQQLWDTAKEKMGSATASVVLACILQRADVIKSPGAYLRTLTRKAASHGFSPTPMVMALLRG